jgi:hypothetical protein
MNKSVSGKGYKWILLVHQMPPKPTSSRVKVWRRLQNIGAVPIKNSLYVLPLTKEASEDFQWLRQEIITQKGDATIFKVDSTEGMSDQDIISQFHRVRDKDYDEIVSKTLQLKNNIQGSIRKTYISVAQKEKYEAELKKLKRHLNEVISLDFFQAPNREKAENAITNCNKIIESLKVSETAPQSVEKICPIRIYNKNEFQNKRWVTRKGLHIDRISSGWLIKRFIDKGASFSFVGEDDVVKNDVGFDIYNTEFSHHGEYCTFETLLKSFNIKDPVLVEIAQIVHDIDLKDDKFGRKEAEGINQIIVGLSQKLDNDKKLLERGIEIFDSLYQYYSSKKRR